MGNHALKADKLPDPNSTNSLADVQFLESLYMQVLTDMERLN